MKNFHTNLWGRGEGEREKEKKRGGRGISSVVGIVVISNLNKL
jgi:hypothetical protein